MRKYNYKVNESTITDELGNPHIVYGISLYIADANTPSRVINDIFPNIEQATALAKMCTEIQLSPVHLDDVIADLLAWVNGLSIKS